MIEELAKKQYILPDDYSEKAALMLEDGICEYNKKFPDKKIVMVVDENGTSLYFAEVQMIDGIEKPIPLKHSALIRSLSDIGVWKFKDDYDDTIKNGIPTDLIINVRDYFPDMIEKFNIDAYKHNIELRNNTYSASVVYDCAGNVAMFFVVVFLGAYTIAHILYNLSSKEGDTCDGE